MDYGGGGASSDVQQSMHHHISNHAHAYTTPQSATVPMYQYPQHMNDGRNMQTSHDTRGTGTSQMHLAHSTYYPDTAAARHSLATPSTPSQNKSPQYARIPSPATQAQTVPRQAQTTYSNPAEFAPGDRSLPSMDVQDETFDEAYAQFILYCNPSFSLETTDTSELKKVFRNPPRSDGKSFSTFTLFELLKKLESKELKTWTELALELGVERPGEGQSSQKVQQYSVRLKRWMRALHIDAFFEYLMGKKHTYYLVVPPVNDPFPDSRDGVPIEEDLAIRAIDPKFRPKRGRKRADEQDQEGELMSAIEPKRPHLDTTGSFHHQREDYPMSAFPSSAVPMSGHPDFASGDAWANVNTPASALGPRSAMSMQSQQLRWRNETPITPHPMSAITPMSAHPDGTGGWDAEPQSAVTPSSTRSGRRRRHGPAVSSAWPSTNTTANGKLRGRPPSNRSVRDGPFVTFPANPTTKEAPVIEINSSRQESQKPDQVGSADSTPAPSNDATESPKSQAVSTSEHQFLTPQLRAPGPAPIARPMTHPGAMSNPSSAASSTTSSTHQRPERLQLRVPQHIGGPVHLVTPPTVMVNGQVDAQKSDLPPPPPPPPLPPPPNSAAGSASTIMTARTGVSWFSAGAGSATSAATTTGVLDDGFLTPNKSPRSTARGLTRPPPLSAITGGISSPMSRTEDLKRGLVQNLLRAEVHPAKKGAKKRKLKPGEATELAEAILSKSGFDAMDELQRLLCASWFGMVGPMSRSGTLASPSAANAQRKIIVKQRLQDGNSSADPAGGGGGSAVGSEVYDVEWASNFAGIEGVFSLKGLKLSSSQNFEAEEHDDEMSWKERFLKADQELQILRERVLDAVS